MIFKNVALKDINLVANEIVKISSTNPIILFDAQMGSGKTTLIKEVCMQLGIEGQVASPTFAIVNIYISNLGDEVYHFDLYRINKAQDAFEIGFYEYIDSGNICLVEWPNIMSEYFPENSVTVKIEPGDSTMTRDFSIILP